MDPYSPVDLAARPRPKIVLTSAGHPAYGAYQPTVLSLPNRISRIAADEGAYNHHIPAPQGMSIGMNHAHSQLQLVLGDFETHSPFYHLVKLQFFSVFCTGSAAREEFAGRSVTSAKYTSPRTGAQKLPPDTFRRWRCFHGGTASAMMR